MNWARSYTSEWRVFRVNRKTWADGQKLEGVDSASITRTADGSLLESGDMEVTGAFETDYYRIVMTAKQGGEVVREDVATLLFDISDGEHDYGTVKNKAKGYSVLYPASTTAVMTGEYAPAGVDGAKYAAELLASAINAPVEVEGSFTLNDHVVHEPGTYILDAAWAVLNAGPDGGYIIQIDGRGVVHIRPRPTEPALVLDSEAKGVMLNGIEYTADISEIPNRYIVIDGNNKTLAVNDDPESPVSTVKRGYYVDEVDTSATPINGETLGEYARRKLSEASVLETEYSYKREYAPAVLLYSMIRASLNGLEGDLRVKSQSINCSHGIMVSEKVTEETALW